MGRTYTPPYRVELDGIWGTMAWKGRVPTVAKLEKFVCDLVRSLLPGGANEHLGKEYGISVPSYARVRENCCGGSVLVEWKCPTFFIIPME